MSSSARPWIIAETNWKQVKSTRYQVAVIPWGATEAHGWHLPYGTDSFQNEGLCAEAGRLAWEQGVKVAVLPNIPFGVQTGQLDIPFCINMNPSTQTLVLRDILASLKSASVQRVVVFNGHGGNDFKQILRELQPQFPELFLSTVFWPWLHSGEGIFDHLGDHADERETSLMLHLHAEWVLPQVEWGRGEARPWKIASINEKKAWASRAWTQVTEDTGVGDPGASTAERGRRYFDLLAGEFARYLVDLAAADLGSLYGEANVS